jgi:L-ribulose-5-phosphate 3-epimerase
LRVLGGWVRQVHIKDAVLTKVPGTWGQEVPVGTGQVDWRAFMATLNAHNPTCDLVIEREAGQQRVADIRFARQTLERIAV